MSGNSQTCLECFPLFLLRFHNHAILKKVNITLLIDLTEHYVNITLLIVIDRKNLVFQGKRTTFDFDDHEFASKSMLVR